MQSKGKPGMSSKVVKPETGQRPEIREWVWEYPIQTEIQASSKHIQVVWNDIILADTKRAYRCSELGVAPYYYIPPQDVAMEYLRPTGDRTHSEWMGVASYWQIVIKKQTLERAVVSLAEPSGQYNKLQNYFCFHAAKVAQATVDDMLVRPMVSEKYLGWITPDILGPFKGEPAADEKIKLMNQILKQRGISVGGQK